VREQRCRQNSHRETRSDPAMESEAENGHLFNLVMKLGGVPEDRPDRDLAIVGLYHFEAAIRAATRQTESYGGVYGVIEGCGFESWADIMTDELGDAIRPQIGALWRQVADARELTRDIVLSEMEGRRSMLDAFASVLEATGNVGKYPPVKVLSLDATWEQVVALAVALLPETQRTVLLDVIDSHRKTPLLLRVTVRALSALLEQG